MRKTALRASGVASFLVFVPLVTGAAQDKSPQPLRTENAFVIRADPRQPAVGAPLTLTFNDYFMQGKKRMVRSTTVTIPASDVVEALTTTVRSNFGNEGNLFVLDVRSRNVQRTTSDPLVLTLASGTVITVPTSVVHDAATSYLRYTYLATAPSTSATGSAEINAGPVISAKCAKDWPDDFRMRKYCEDQQHEGVNALQARMMSDTSDHQTIRTKCATDWPDDFRMRNYCEVRQLEALKGLRDK